MGIEFTCRLLHIHDGGIERCFYGIFIARSIKMLIQYACDSGGVGARRLRLCLSFLSLSLSPFLFILPRNTFEPIWGIVISARFLAPC